MDIVHYPHKRIDNIENTGNLRLYSDKDICAMKINAILGRGKKKDFWDIHELLQHYTLQNLLEWHSEKYPNQMLLISIPEALAYFADAEESEDPVSLKGQNWEQVKKFIQQKVNDYLR